MKCPDRGRTAVGAAELACFGGTVIDDERPIAELAGRARRLVAGSWWRAVGGPHVVVVAGRAGARSSSARSSPSSATVEIRLADGQRDIATLAHELAHALAGIEHGHAAVFRAAEVDVLSVLAGDDHGTALRACFTSFELPVEDRAWPAPPATAGETFVLLT